MDTAGNKAARSEIAMIKVAAPNMLCTVLDWAIQAHGAAGVSDDFPLAHGYAYPRPVRIVDGPDEVHLNPLGPVAVGKHTPDASGDGVAPTRRLDLRGGG